MTAAAIGLGTSLGDRHAHLALAVRRIGRLRETTLEAVSRVVITPPLRGGSARGWFANAVVVVQTGLDAEALLDALIEIERGAGRRRSRPWGDRTLDLDLLLFGDLILQAGRLRLPHPAIAARPFVWYPLAEVWPEAVDPRTQQPWTPALAGPRARLAGLVDVPRPRRRAPAPR